MALLKIAAAKATMEIPSLQKSSCFHTTGSAGRTAARDDLRAQCIASKPVDIKQKCIEAPRHVSTLVNAKAPDDAVASKRWLRHVSQRVAEAANEGRAFWALAAYRLARRRKRRWRRSQALWAFHPEQRVNTVMGGSGLALM
jgi:hypothetical protein